MEEELYCPNCGWTGDSTMLESATEDINDNVYNRCPDCGWDDVEDFDHV